MIMTKFVFAYLLHLHTINVHVHVYVLGINTSSTIHGIVLYSPSVVVPVSIPNEHSTVSLVEVTLDKLCSSSGPFQVGGVTQYLVGSREATDH